MTPTELKIREVLKNFGGSVVRGEDDIETALSAISKLFMTEEEIEKAIIANAGGSYKTLGYIVDEKKLAKALASKLCVGKGEK